MISGGMFMIDLGVVLLLFVIMGIVLSMRIEKWKIDASLYQRAADDLRFSLELKEDKIEALDKHLDMVRGERAKVMAENDHLRVQLSTVLDDLHALRVKLRLKTEALEAAQAAAPMGLDITYSVSLMPNAFNGNPELVRQHVENMILNGIAEQLKDYIEIDPPIYKPFYPPLVVGRLTILEKEEADTDE